MTLQVKKRPDPTPPHVRQAIATIAEYMREHGWREAVITDEGGASFRLESMSDIYFGRSVDAAVED